jgi:hypothetical protein
MSTAQDTGRVYALLADGTAAEIRQARPDDLGDGAPPPGDGGAGEGMSQLPGSAGGAGDHPRPGGSGVVYRPSQR